MAAVLGWFKEKLLGSSSSSSNSTSLHSEFSKEHLESVLASNKEKLEELEANTGRTPLHCACFRGDLAGAVQLVSRDAELNPTDADGKTPIQLAIRAYHGSLDNEEAKNKWIEIVMLLLCLGANMPPEAPDNGYNDDEDNAKVKNNEKKEWKMGSVLAQARKWLQFDEDEAKGQEEVIRAKRSTVYHLTKFHKHAQKVAVEHKLDQELTSGNRFEKGPFRLLAMDGGGIRGLVAALVLFELERRFALNHSQKTLPNETFVSQYFDWLAGTSTGAILALGFTNGFSPKDGLHLYLRLKNEIFPKSTGRPYPPPNNALKNVLGAKKMSNFGISNANGRLRVFATATNAAQIPLEIEFYRNYDMKCEEEEEENEDPEKVKAKKKEIEAKKNLEVYRAARRSSAAPMYFTEADEHYLDGGLMANNPSAALLYDVSQLLMYNMLQDETNGEGFITHSTNENGVSSDDTLLGAGVAYLLSIGTGVVHPKDLQCTDLYKPWRQNCSGDETGLQDPGKWALWDFLSNIWKDKDAMQSLSNIFIGQITETGGPNVKIVEMATHMNRIPYFRFTPQLDDTVELDETDDAKLIRMLWTTKVYMYEEEQRKNISTLFKLMSHFKDN